MNKDLKMNVQNQIWDNDGVRTQANIIYYVSYFVFEKAFSSPIDVISLRLTNPFLLHFH